ncbi:MAG: VCBS repeat-containing protein [Nitrospinae bacterium]|nr:VCBS repeat-containing protein [Nitrospinota bacterium]
MKKYLVPGFLLVALLVFPLACAKQSKPPQKVSRLFALTYNYSSGKEPSFLIAEDFDKDENLDLVVANSASNTFSFYKGNPDGSFNEQVVYQTGADPICVAAADFNKDGLPDLAELNYADQDIRVFLNTGRGGFRNAGHVLKPGKIPINLTAGDFNEDGFPDLAVTLRFHKVVILFGKGNGNFSEPENIPMLGQPTALVAGDYNNDKHVDIAVALAGTGNTGVEILWGKGNGQFEPSKRFKGGGQPLSIANIDVNGDGYLDIITSSNPLHAITFLLNNKDGTFKTMKDFAAGDFPKFIAAGDFNGDGVPDIAVTNSTNDLLAVSLGRKDGTFTYPPIFHPTDAYPQGIVVGDFNHDGLIDIAVSCRDKGLIDIFLKKNMVNPSATAS